MCIYAELIQDFKKGAAKEKKLQIEAEVQICKGLRTNGQISIDQAGQFIHSLLPGIFPVECGKVQSKVFQGTFFINGF